eukprot:CAMPEP_0184298278 /NCGR_PEP_ID=MMETSP1049-20130417/9109_1 /TAXON_ID=77928 /ORGANISM="Proteomonas sulcata, Strain CCMP704" /LENGTH=330 /DNA_ID=CAMNT_0026608357 /DNA_START=274 /DNA_END=1266 /DNA_ORIENTATION=+
MKALDELTKPDGKGGKVNFANIRQRCVEGDNAACLAVGLMHMEGSGGAKQDLQAASDTMRKLCSGGGQPKACFYLGRIHDGMVDSNGRGLPRNAFEASTHFKAACDGGVGEGCFNFAQMLDQGRVPGQEKDQKNHKHQKRIAKFFRLACEKGIAKGCVNLGVMHIDGTGVPANPNLAFRFFRGACDLGVGAGCGFAADLIQQEMVQADKSQAAELYYEACKIGHSKSCITQGKLLSAAAAKAVEDGTATGEHALHAKARAIMFYRRACELADAKGCKLFFQSKDALKMIDTRNDDEKSWLNVTPSMAQDDLLKKDLPNTAAKEAQTDEPK